LVDKAMAEGAIYQNPVFFWALGLVCGFPLLMILLTELLIRLRQRSHPAEELVRAVRNLLLPVSAVLLFLTRVLGDFGSGAVLRVAQTLLWISLIHVALTTLNVILFGDSSEAGWRGRVPKLLRDISRTVLVLVGSGIVLSSVWQADLKGFLAALGLGSLVIGWALQDTLGNVISGFVLLFERTVQTGDWIKVGETIGRVTEVTWRTVQLVTRGNELIVVPNATLAKNTISNYSRPTVSHYEFIRLSFSAAAPPNQVKQMLRQVAMDVDEIDRSVPLAIVILSMDRDAAVYLIRVPVLDYFAAPRIVDQLLTLIWYASQRLKLPLAGASRTLTMAQLETAQPDADRAHIILSKAVGLGNLAPEILEDLADSSRLLSYGSGETIVRRDAQLPGLCLIVAGQIELELAADGDRPAKLLRLGPGELFGEEALVGQAAAQFTATALTDCEIVVMTDAAIQTLVQRAPHNAREISLVGRERARGSASARA
jgi:small-conductance mechanosensitive channel